MILNWVIKAKELGATHLILVYDTEDKEEYPVYVKPEEDIEEKVKKIRLSEGKQKIKEICKIQ